MKMQTVDVCNRCGAINVPNRKNICKECHGSVTYSDFPKTIVIQR